ncbi:hypothetical protein [Coleofasciculus chthonoplastes]
MSFLFEEGGVISAELAGLATAKTASPLACRKGGIVLVYIVILSMDN